MAPASAEPAPAPEMVCQVCGTTMAPDAAVYCARCATPHHADCWAYAGRCATFGCHGTARTSQAPPPPTDAPLILTDGALGERDRLAAAPAGPTGFAEPEGSLAFVVRRLVSLRAPRDAFVFQTRLPLEAAAAALRARTEPERLLRLPWSTHLDFEGTVGDRTFDVRRIIDYRNSFLPRLSGQFVALAKGTGVSVRMGLHAAVKAMAAILCSLVGLSFLVGLGKAASGDPSGLAAMAIAVLVLAVGAGSAIGSFWYEVREARSLLGQIFADAQASPSAGLTATPSRQADER